MAGKDKDPMQKNVIPILTPPRRPIGTFHAAGSRDATSLERDGQAYYQMNDLDTADGRPLCEVQFADGTWLLADPTQDLRPAPRLPGPTAR